MTKPTMEDLNAMRRIVTTENGNLKVSERNKLRESVVKYLPQAFEKMENLLVITKEGVSFPVLIDAATGKPVYVHVEFTISMKEPQPLSAKE